MKPEIQMLQEASSEIKRLRRQNELMNARLEMFDTCIGLLNTKIASNDMAMTPDLVYKIDKHIAIQEANG